MWVYTSISLSYPVLPPLKKEVHEAVDVDLAEAVGGEGGEQLLDVDVRQLLGHRERPEWKVEGEKIDRGLGGEELKKLKKFTLSVKLRFPVSLYIQYKIYTITTTIICIPIYNIE